MLEKIENIMIEKLLSPIAFEIWKMLDHPEDWQPSRGRNDRGNPYSIIHEKTEIALWVSNGRYFLNGNETTVYEYDNKGSVIKKLYTTKAPYIGSFERHILWYKVAKVLSFLKYKEHYKIDSLLNNLKRFNQQRGEINWPRH